MANVKAKADKESSSTSKKYSVFFGRWQPFHKGHYWLINERLKEGKNVWVAIRDVKPDEKNPWTAQEVLKNLSIEALCIGSTGDISTPTTDQMRMAAQHKKVTYSQIDHAGHLSCIEEPRQYAHLIKNFINED